MPLRENLVVNNKNNRVFMSRSYRSDSSSTETLYCLNRTYSQSEYSKVVVFSTVLQPTSTSYTALIVLATVFSMARCEIVMLYFLVIYHGISHLYPLSPNITHTRSE